MEARSFLLDLLKDKDAHDNFLLQLAGPKRFRRASGIIVLTSCRQGALGWVVLGSNSPTSKLVWFTAQKVLEDLESDSCTATELSHLRNCRDILCPDTMPRV